MIQPHVNVIVVRGRGCVYHQLFVELFGVFGGRKMIPCKLPVSMKAYKTILIF
jgi:hypothetical protein